MCDDVDESCGGRVRVAEARRASHGLRVDFDAAGCLGILITLWIVGAERLSTEWLSCCFG